MEITDNKLLHFVAHPKVSSGRHLIMRARSGESTSAPVGRGVDGIDAMA
jgi:hypothetical protein